MPEEKYDFVGKMVLVMGLGRFGGGIDSALFAAKSGAKVIITDLANEDKLSRSIEKLKDYPEIEFHLGFHNPEDFEKADIIIANPAVSFDNKFLKIAREATKFVTSQINIFFELCPAKTIGITGANGKSTTTALTAHLLRCMSDEQQATNYETVWLGGNIGNQPLLTNLDKIKPNDLVVLELSSFQIEQLAEIKKAPDIALLTNLTPNHLDRYGTFEKYCASKQHIFENQKLDIEKLAISIFNAEDEIAIQWYEKYKNDAGRTCLRFSADDVPWDIRDCYILPGRANLSNLAAALAIARYFGLDDESIKKSLPEFKALPHRLELVEDRNGIRWYNDSKATTPEGAITALDAFDEPIILIAGGYDKHLPFDKLAEKIIEKTKAAVLIGQTAPKIAQAIEKADMSLRRVPWGRRGNLQKKRATSHERQATKVKIANSLPDAVKMANKLAKPSDVVLLSPACASYDMFDNYEQRGQEFSELIK